MSEVSISWRDIPTEDGDTVELDDGRVVRLRVEADEYSDGPDGDWFGALAPVERNRCTGRDRARPEGFDGRARKISVNRHNDRWWWQPPADVADEHLDGLRRGICDIMEYGYQVYVLEMCEGVDAYGNGIVVDVQALGGIEPFADSAYVQDIVGDMLAEMGVNVDHTGREGREGSGVAA